MSPDISKDAVPEWYLYSENNKPLMVFNNRELALKHLEREPILLNPTERLNIKWFRESSLPPIGKRLLVVKWTGSEDRELIRIYGPSRQEVERVEKG